MSHRLDHLKRAWQTEAARLREFAPGAAAAFERCANELAVATDAERDHPVTLKKAAKLSGFSYSQLYRMVRSGKLEGVGRGAVIRVRVGDLPRKPGGGG